MLWKIAQRKGDRDHGNGGYADGSGPALQQLRQYDHADITDPAERGDRRVDTESKQIHLQFDESAVNLDRIRETLDEIGYSPDD